MSGLREALEKLCDTMEPMDDRCSAAYLREMLAAHPAEPAPVVTDEMVDAAVDVLMDYGHNGLQCDPTPNFSTPVRRALEAAVAEMNGAESCVCDFQGSALSASCKIHGARS